MQARIRQLDCDGRVSRPCANGSRDTPPARPPMPGRADDGGCGGRSEVEDRAVETLVEVLTLPAGCGANLAAHPAVRPRPWILLDLRGDSRVFLERRRLNLG